MNQPSDRPHPVSSDVGLDVGLEVDIEAALARAHVPGCSLAVLDGDRIVLDRAFGTSRGGTGEPMTRATRLQACSMSKPVAVLAVLRLVEQGLLDLDVDVSEYLTRWTLPSNGDWRPRISVRQLASHTAGLHGSRRLSRLPPRRCRALAGRGAVRHPPRQRTRSARGPGSGRPVPLLGPRDHPPPAADGGGHGHHQHRAPGGPRARSAPHARQHLRPGARRR